MNKKEEEARWEGRCEGYKMAMDDVDKAIEEAGKEADSGTIVGAVYDAIHTGFDKLEEEGPPITG